MRIPSLANDDVVNGDFLDRVKPKIKKGKKELEKDAEKILTDVYFLELCKYIDTLQVGDDVIRFSDKDTIKQSFKLLQKLPTQILAQVTSYISDIREYRDSVIFYTNSENKDVPLNVDIALFTGI